MKWQEFELPDGRTRYETVIFKSSVMIVLWPCSAIGFEEWNVSVLCLGQFCGKKTLKEKSRDFDKVKKKALVLAEKIIRKDAQQLSYRVDKMASFADKLHDSISK